MGINLLEELDKFATSNQKFGFKIAFLVTYGVNLQFFERLVLPKLDRLRISYTGILSDSQAYQASLSGPTPPEQCGKHYVFGYSPWLKGLQHGKLLWLHGDQDMVFIGSHNLTRSGFNDSLETTVCLDSRDPGHLPAIKSAHNAVSRLVENSNILSRIWTQVSPPKTRDSVSNTHFLWSGNGSLLSQLQQIIKSAEEIRVVTPFLDASALHDLCLGFSAKKVILDLPAEGADTPLRDALRLVPFATPRVVSMPHRLHGKAYEFTSVNLSWLAIGSANCTRAGIINGISDGGNSEFLTVFPAKTLEDENVEFNVISNTVDFPCTGRRWDEDDSSQNGSIHYLVATFEDGILTVEWKSEAQLSNPHIILGEQEIEVSNSPFSVPLDGDIPQYLTLVGHLSGKEISAKAWIVFFNDLADHASSIGSIRRRSYLESEDPLQHAFGIEFEIQQLLQQLRVSKPGIGQAMHLVEKNLNKADVDQAVTVFEFSPDPNEILHRATSLIVGDHNTDPLALIRGLVARITGPVSTNYQNDEESIQDHDSKREKAIDRVSNSIISHLNQLTRIDALEWNATPLERIEVCLQGTLEVSVLLWFKVLRRNLDYFQGFTQSMLLFLESLAGNKILREACKTVKVAGPLILAISAVSDASSDEQERDLLRMYLSRLASTEYHASVEEWLKAYPIRAAMIVRIKGDANTEAGLQSRLEPMDRLEGIADNHLIMKQEQKWGLLLHLIDILGQGKYAEEAIFKELQLKFGDHPVWQKCRSIIKVGRIPIVQRVAKPICGKCFGGLPEKHRHDLEKGEIVICPNCGAILIFGKLA